MRLSLPMARLSEPMSAPSESQSCDSSFMNEMRTASMAFDAYLASSAERRSMISTRSLESCSGR